MNRSTHRNVLFSLFSHIQDKTWNEVVEAHQKLPTNQLDLRKQQEAVWELFTSECTYFLDHLLVLKMVMLALIFVVGGKHCFFRDLFLSSMLKEGRKYGVGSPLSEDLKEILFIFGYLQLGFSSFFS